MNRDYLDGLRRKKILAAVCAALLVPCSFAYVSSGIISIPWADVLRILAGGFPSVDAGDTKSAVIWMIRLPRVAAGALVGAGLAVAGAAYQGIFRNRLADPYMTGVSAGATLGCAIAILLGFEGTLLGVGGLAFFAFCGALGASLFVFAFTAASRRVSSSAILLVGISLNLFLSGIVALLMFLNRNKIEAIVVWTMGSLSGLTWTKILFALPLFLTGLAGLFFCARPLDYLALGGDIARVHGIPVKRCTFLVILFSSLVTAVCVSLCGIVGFVGLVIPNIVRLVFGPRSRMLFVFSCALGALFFQFTDFLARSLLAPAELPVGILTSITGVPFFVFLILRRRGESA
jgi:iron complex transport system permease protein